MPLANETRKIPTAAGEHHDQRSRQRRRQEPERQEGGEGDGRDENRRPLPDHLLTGTARARPSTGRGSCRAGRSRTRQQRRRCNGILPVSRRRLAAETGELILLEPALALLAHGDEARLLQHLQVLRDGLLGDVELRGDLSDREGHDELTTVDAQSPYSCRRLPPAATKRETGSRRLAGAFHSHSWRRPVRHYRGVAWPDSRCSRLGSWAASSTRDRMPSFA